MRDRPLKLWLVAASIAVLLPCSVLAAGLGRLTVHSGLGQVLNAEIELVAVKRGETITARLAPPEVYQQANAQFNPALVGTRITVEKRANGDLYLKAATPRPVQEPFVELIVELNSESGRVTRQYTALLDPPGYGRAAGEIPPPRVDTGTPPVAAAPAAPPEPAPEAAAVPATDTVAAPKEAPIAKPAAKGKASKAPAPTASPDAGQYGPVKPGETLRGIARIVRPDGVTVEQTLVALHRQNPDAFIRKNMNLVKSGKILRVPDANEIVTVSQPDAVREVKLQLADFNSFRDRIAARVPNAPEDGSATRGRIGSAVTDAAGSAPRDTVRVSQGEPAGKAAVAAAKGSAAEDRIRLLEEEAIARQRALAEASDRIGQLEKTIKDMQRLAELKTTGAAAPQKSPDPGAAKPAPDTKAVGGTVGTIAPPRIETGKAPPGAGGPVNEPPRVAPAEGAGALPGVSADASASGAKEAPVGRMADLPPPAVAPKAAPVPAPPSAPSFFDDLMDGPLYLGLAVAVVLLGVLGLVAARRRRASARVRADDGDKIPPTLAARSLAGGAGAAARPTVVPSAPAAPASKPPETRAAQAAPSVQAAASARPRAPAATDNDLDFDLSPGGAPAGAQSATRFPGVRPTVTAAEAPRPDRASPPAAASPAVREPEKPAVPHAVPLAAAAAVAAAGVRATEPGTTQPAAKSPSSDFSLDPHVPAAPAPTEPPKASNLIDFNLDAPPARSAAEPMAAERVSSEPPPRDFEFKLDLDGLDLSTPGESKPAGETKDAHWYDVQQKFDLAKAYEEMGDKEGARDILREVLKEGDPEQRTQAIQTLANLG